MYMGRLIATFEPRRFLMFAVRVLKIAQHNDKPPLQRKTTGADARKAGMRVCDLLREKQAVAGDGPGGIVIRLGESSRDAEMGERCEGDGNLIRFQIRAGQVTPCFLSAFSGVAHSISEVR